MITIAETASYFLCDLTCLCQQQRKLFLLDLIYISLTATKNASLQDQQRFSSVGSLIFIVHLSPFLSPFPPPLLPSQRTESISVSFPGGLGSLLSCYLLSAFSCTTTRNLLRGFGDFLKQGGKGPLLTY